MVTNILKDKLKLSLPVGSIYSAYRIGKRPVTQAPDTRNILVKLSDLNSKSDIMGSCRRVKPTGLYVNESLIPARAEILFVLRQAKRKHSDKVAAVGSRNGVIFVWLKSTNAAEKSTKTIISSMTQLQNFCNGCLGVSVTDLMNRRLSK